MTDTKNGWASAETAEVTEDLAQRTRELEADEVACAGTRVNIRGSAAAG